MVKESRQKFIILVFGIVGMLLSGNICVFAFSPVHNTFPRQPVIRQETLVVNGVYICRPRSLDVKICEIINNNNVVSLEGYADWLEQNVKYLKDENGDNWASPEETLQRKSGDCEDYAFLNAAVLEMLGYQPEVWAVRRPGRCHAICIFKEKGYYGWIDNCQLKRTSISSLSEFRAYLMNLYICRHIFVLNFEEEKDSQARLQAVLGE